MGLRSRPVLIAGLVAVVLVMVSGAALAIKLSASRPPTRQALAHAAPSAASSGQAITGPTAPGVSSTASATSLAAATPAATERAFTPPAGYPIPDYGGSQLGYDELHGQVIMVNQSQAPSGQGPVAPTAWRWDGTGWVRFASTVMPPSPGPPLVYDPMVAQLVTAGGNSLWGWDGSRWSDLRINLPSLSGGYLVFDSARRELVLLADASHTQTATWVYDGRSWNRKTTTTAPEPRFSGAMAYDPRTSTVVLYGGICIDADLRPDGCPLNETWTWDGTTWTLRHPQTSPRIGGSAKLAYDAADRQMILLQHTNPCPACATVHFDTSTWAWDGSDWTELHPAAQPTHDGYAQMAFDSAHGYVLFFSGAGQYEAGTETWTFVRGEWTRRS